MPSPSPSSSPSPLLKRLKPAASARTQVLAAALLWTLVGTGLLSMGLVWSTRGGSTRGGTTGGAVERVAPWLALAAVLGALKARFVLSRTATRVLARIETRGDGRCLGGFLSWKTWLLVAAMMAGGRILRGGLLPIPVVGILYVAIGVALLGGAYPFWRGWRGWHAGRASPKSDGA